MDECVFCKLVRGEIPSTKVYEDDEVLAFMDIMPTNKGHTLVISKEHYPTIVDVPEELFLKVTAVLKKVAIAVKQGSNADGISIIQRNFAAADQIVPHLHFNIIPRFADDGLKEWPQTRYENDEERQAYADKIKEFM